MGSRRFLVLAGVVALVTTACGGGASEKPSFNLPTSIGDGEGQLSVLAWPGYVENGRIVLNIHPRAIHGFSFDHGGIRFSARFGGSPYVIDIPLAGLLAIYAKENGQGVSFPERDEPPPAEPAAPGRPAPAPRKGPVLKRVK